MKKVKSYLQVIFGPLTGYLKRVYHFIRLTQKNPTLKLGGKISAGNTLFGKHNFLGDGVTILNSEIGDFSYIADASFIENVKIGKFTCIGPHVKIGLGIHPVQDFISIHPVFYSLRGQAAGVSFADKQYFTEYQPSEIGNDVWIGANVVIPGGIRIGNGAVIASGAVVTKDVPPYAIAGGVPAKIIRYRFPEEQVQQLQNWQWWNKDPAWLREHFKDMHHISNLEELMK